MPQMMPLNWYILPVILMLMILIFLTIMFNSYTNGTHYSSKKKLMNNKMNMKW